MKTTITGKNMVVSPGVSERVFEKDFENGALSQSQHRNFCAPDT